MQKVEYFYGDESELPSTGIPGYFYYVKSPPKQFLAWDDGTLVQYSGGNLINDAIAVKADKVTSPVANNILIMDEFGNTMDSGKGFNDLVVKTADGKLPALDGSNLFNLPNSTDGISTQLALLMEDILKSRLYQTGLILGSNAWSDSLEDISGINTSLSSGYSFNSSNKSITSAPVTYPNTKLMLHMDGANGSTTFTDSMGKVVTAAGNAQLSTAQSKFGGVSALFDGAGDYLTVPTSDDFNFGTSDFTIDMWVRRNGAPSYAGLVSSNYSSGNGWAFGFGNGDGKIRCVWNAAQQLLSTNAVPDLTWTHVAIVRYGNTVTCYINGNANGTANVAGVSLNTAETTICIGALNTGNYFFNGHIDELRIVKGVAKWTTDFTPPTQAYSDVLTKDDCMKLMLHMNGVDNGVIIADDSGHIATNSGVVTKTATKKFGTASGYFNGSSNVSFPVTDFQIGLKDFTISCWANFANVADGTEIIFSGSATNGTFQFGIYNVGGLHIGIGQHNSTWDKVEIHNIPNNTWTHLAVTRKAGYVRIFIDGVQIGGATLCNINYTLNSAAIVGGHTSGAMIKNSYIDELQVLIGMAEWTENFTPPTSEYVIQRVTATVIWKPVTSISTLGKGIVEAIQVARTGTITYYISRDGGSTFTLCTIDTVTDISAQPSGKSIVLKAVITNDAELYGVAWGGVTA